MATADFNASALFHRARAEPEDPTADINVILSVGSTQILGGAMPSAIADLPHAGGAGSVG
jgi:hypothetical protein